MIQLEITMTGKGYHPSSEWRVFAEDKHQFRDMDAAKGWLRERYGSCKRGGMYRDYESGTVQTGYVYGFRSADLSHAPVDKWLQQDWVEFVECRPVNPNN